MINIALIGLGYWELEIQEGTNQGLTGQDGSYRLSICFRYHVQSA